MPGTTPVYGFPYPEPTDLVADYPALGQDLAEDIEAVLPTIDGLAPATPTSIANSGGTASLTGNTVTFSGVSSVSLNGCFTGDYDNYRVLVDGQASGVIATLMRFRVSGSDNSTANYTHLTVSANPTVVTNRVTGDTAFNLFYLGSGVRGTLAIDVFAPFASLASRASSYGLYDVSAPGMALITGGFTQTTSFDGFTLYPSSGTITGTVSVYGYKK